MPYVIDRGTPNDGTDNGCTAPINEERFPHCSTALEWHRQSRNRMLTLPGPFVTSPFTDLNKERQCTDLFNLSCPSMEELMNSIVNRQYQVMHDTLSMYITLVHQCM